MSDHEYSQVEGQRGTGFAIWLWGETDVPIVVIARSRDDVRRLFVEHWLGEEGEELDIAMAAFDDHDWQESDTLEYEFEIGGIEVTDCFID